jgi:uncharacterized protein YwqG
MDLLKEQAITCIRQSGMPHIANDLISLLRYSIRLNIDTVPEQSLELGASKIGGTPDLPAGIGWPTSKGVPLPFYAQIRCADLVPYDQGKVLPHTGWLYFFYDVLSDLSYSARRQNRSDSWRVLYAPLETEKLHRTPAPASLDEWEQYDSCAVTFSSDIMLPDFGAHSLEQCGLSYSAYTGESKEHEYYQKLLDQLRNLSGPASKKGIHLLGYPDEFGPEQDSEWILLLQIDTNRAALQGATKMAKGDWLTISFWIPRDALARCDFNQVETLINGD